MTQPHVPENRVREIRRHRQLTQAELAARAGISRTAVTAIEGNQLVPSVAAALALAEVLETSVEALFGRAPPSDTAAAWAWESRSAESAYWEAEVGGRRWRFPADSSPMWTPLPDGPPASATADQRLPRRTLVVACCDPAAGLLATAYARSSGYRMLILQRSSGQALEMLRERKVHLAGLHLATELESERNAQTVREALGSNYHLLRVAQWQEGIAAASGSRITSVGGAVRSKLRWIGREPGSGARQCLDRLLDGRPAPRRLARNHRGVAEAVACGWADAGVCVQLTCLEAGLSFLPVQEESYDLCVSDEWLDDPRVRALVRVVRSPDYRGSLARLPGYNVTQTGNLRRVTS